MIPLKHSLLGSLIQMWRMLIGWFLMTEFLVLNITLLLLFTPKTVRVVKHFIVVHLFLPPKPKTNRGKQLICTQNSGHIKN